MKKETLYIVVVLAIAAIAFAVYFYTNVPMTKTTEVQTNQLPTQEPPQVSPQGIKNAPQIEVSNTSKERNVEIQNFAFSPAVSNINIGDFVVWTNKDGTVHSIIGDNFHSDKLDLNSRYSHTFNTAGTFEYHCGYHSSMKGTIIVK